MKAKFCNKCGKTKSLSKFTKDSKKHDGYRSGCTDCRNKRRRENRKKNPEKFKKYERHPNNKFKQWKALLKREYGITSCQYNKMFSEQNGKCKICKKVENHKTKRLLTVDHCHTTGKVRGLLCHRCNCALGLLYDNQELLKKSIEYLKENEE